MRSQFPELSARAWLAPMSGSTDAAFRRQVVRFGGRAVVSEMVASEALVAGREDVLRRMCRHEGGGPWIVQLAARRPEDMQAGAAFLSEAGVDIIDINMGCPARQVTGGQSGSALMRDLDVAQSIIDAALEGAGSVPVTLKMRLGWDATSLNAPELAKIAEASGLAWITVHGRTRCMFYKGKADWAAIARTRAACALPLIANGDICTLDDAKTALQQSGADAVMIGRGAMGRPWRVGEIEAALRGTSWAPPSLEEQLDSLLEQISDSVALYGSRLGVRIVRKHISAMIEHVDLDLAPDVQRQRRSELCQIDDERELCAALRRTYQRHIGAMAA